MVHLCASCRSSFLKFNCTRRTKPKMAAEATMLCYKLWTAAIFGKFHPFTDLRSAS